MYFFKNKQRNTPRECYIFERINFFFNKVKNKIAQILRFNRFGKL